MSIVIFPLQKSYASKFVYGEKQGGIYKDWPEGSRTWANKKLPALYTAYDLDTKEFCTWGFRSRQASHSCQLICLGGFNTDLVHASLVACVYAAVLECRKRI